jgi:hypothetical protein
MTRFKTVTKNLTLCLCPLNVVQEKKEAGEKKRSADEIEAEAPDSPAEKKKKKKKAKTDE